MTEKFMIVRIEKPFGIQNSHYAHMSQSCYDVIEKGFNSITSALEKLKTLKDSNQMIVVQYWVN